MAASVVISGIPSNVSVSRIALSLDRLFHRHGISSFRARALPLDVRGKPQAALDFTSRFDAMAAEEILNGYTYEINDREYILRAKMTTDPRVMQLDRSARSYLDISLGRHSRGEERRSRITDDVDTELNYLSKKLLVVEQERKLIQARKKLKKELKNIRSDSDTDADIEPAKKKKKYNKHKIKRSTARRRSGSRDSSPSPRTAPLEEAVKPSRSKSRSRNRSSTPISVSSSGSEMPSRKSKASSSVKKSRSRSRETLVLVPYRPTSAKRTPAPTRRDSPQPSTSRARDKDSSRERTSRNGSPTMSERRRLRSRSLSRSRSPIGRRSPGPSPSQQRASPRKSKSSPPRRRSRSASWPRRSRYDSANDRSVVLRSRRSRSTSWPRRSRYDSANDISIVVRSPRTLYQAENYDFSITEITDATWAGIDEVLKDADKSQAEEKNEEETPVETASEKINVVINVVKKETEDKKIIPVPMILDGNIITKESDDVKKTTGVTITNTGEYDPELIKKMMPRPMVLDADMIKKEVDKEKSKNKIPRPIVVEMDNIEQEAEVDEEKRKKEVSRPIVVEVVDTRPDLTPAKQLPVTRYQNKRLVVDRLLDQLYYGPRVKHVTEIRAEVLNPINVAVNALVRLGFPTAGYDYQLVHATLRRLPGEVAARFEQAHGGDSVEHMPTFEVLRGFLETECLRADRQQEGAPVQASGSSHHPVRVASPRQEPQPARRHNATTGVAKCAYCHQVDHGVIECPAFCCQRVQSRRAIAQLRKWCYRCLGKHFARQCPASKNCGYCQGDHHDMLCLKRSGAGQASLDTGRVSDVRPREGGQRSPLLPIPGWRYQVPPMATTHRGHYYPEWDLYYQYMDPESYPSQYTPPQGGASRGQ